MTIIGRDLFLHAAKSQILLKKAVRTFEEYLEKKLPPDSLQYYQARHYLREGQSLLDETLKKAKLVLGPGSSYSTQDVKAQRDRFLSENRIIAQGLSLSELKDELSRDEFLKPIFSPEEIAAFLEANFIFQISGERKLANIKLRMILDKLKALSDKGRELQAAAQKYFQGR